MSHPAFDEDWEEEKEDGMKVIFFWAPWCASCKITSPSFQISAKNNPDVSFEDCNTDEEYGMANMYGIRSIPSLVFVKNGKIFKIHSGAISDIGIDVEIDIMRFEKKQAG